MTVRVRLYAGLRQLVGDNDIELALPAGATVAMLRDRLAAEYPVLEAFLGTLVCAVAEEVQPPGHVLADGDRVNIIPPIAGGVTGTADCADYADGERFALRAEQKAESRGRVNRLCSLLSALERPVAGGRGTNAGFMTTAAR